MRTVTFILIAALGASALVAQEGVSPLTGQRGQSVRPPIELPPLPIEVSVGGSPVQEAVPVPADGVVLELPEIPAIPQASSPPLGTNPLPSLEASQPLAPLPSPGIQPPTYQPIASPFISGQPASVPTVKLGFSDIEQDSMVKRYIDRSSQLLDDDDLGLESVTEFPMGFQPWWSQQISAPMRNQAAPLGVTFEEIILSALTHSRRVRASRIEPTIKQRSVAIERAQFDWLSFAEMTWDDTSDPVGNTLTTGPGGANRFRDHKWNLENGVRRRTLSGGEFEVSNQIGWQDNNSDFFVPAPQGTSRLSVSFTQPLLRSRGRFFNTSRIVLARIDTALSQSDTLVKLQDHLVEVSQVYWQLYRARASLLQKRKVLERATTILERLEGRRGVDVLQRQILRARAAVASRRSEIARAAATVRNSEARLRSLVNDPSLVSGTPLELVPADSPLIQNLVYSTPETVTVGLMTRPDIAKAIREIRQHSVRLGVTKAELLPKLDLILSGYVAGLEGQGDIWESTRNWWQQGEPGYSVGFKFEYPLGNRAARAMVEQQQFRLRKAFLEFQNTVETGITEIELAVREARTSYAEMLSRYQSMRSAEAETEYLQERWQELPGDDRTTSELLEDLLDAQERVANEEYSFESARMNYMMALIEIKRSTGTLLASEDGRSLMKQRASLSGAMQSGAIMSPSGQPGVSSQAFGVPMEQPAIGIPIQPQSSPAHVRGAPTVLQGIESDPSTLPPEPPK